MNVFDEKYPQKQLTKNSQMLLRVHRKFTHLLYVLDYDMIAYKSHGAIILHRGFVYLLLRNCE